MYKKLLNICLGLGVAFFSLSFVASDALAVPVSPDKYFVDINDSSVVTNELKIYGKQDQEDTKTVYISVLGMSKVGEGDERSFFNVDSSLQEELAAHIALDQTEVELAPGATVVVNWTLTPNPEIKCGTNLAAIVVTETPVELTDNGESAVSFESEVISQVHANVNVRNGNTCENAATLTLDSFGIDQGASVFNHGDVPFTTRLENTGNLIARGPVGFIEVFGFGDKVTLPFNPTELDVYPGTFRTFENQWLDEEYPSDGNVFSQFVYELTHLRIGRYEARVGITKNVEPEQIVASVSFWVLPWKIIFVLLLIVAIIAVLTVMLVKTMSKNRELTKTASSAKTQPQTKA